MESRRSNVGFPIIGDRFQPLIYMWSGRRRLFHREERFSATVHISLNIGRFTQVRADLHTHKGAAHVFFERIVALDRRVVLLCEAGADTQILRGPPVPIVRLRVACHSNDFAESLYRVENYWGAARVSEALGSPLAALVVSLLRLNHPEPDLLVFLRKETSLKVLSMTRTLLEEGSLTAGRLAKLVVIPLKDDGTHDYEASFECSRQGEHSLTIDAAPLWLVLGQAIDATTTDAAVQMRQLASNLSEEEQTELAAELATTSALLILPGAFARRAADCGRRRRSWHGPDDSRFAHRP